MMNQVFLLTYRHSLTFMRRLPFFLCIYVLVPLITLYGLSKGFELNETSARFMVPGFMINAAAASAFMSTIYGSLMRLTMQGSYNAWLAATLNVHQLIAADVLWSSLRSTLVGLGVALGGSYVVGFFPWAAILICLPIVFLTAAVCALIGLCIVSRAYGFDDVGMYEPVMAAIFVFSGVFASTTHFPLFVQWAMQLQPIYHGIHAARPLFEGAYLSSAPYLHVVVLLVAGLVIYPLTYKLFHSRLIT